MEFKSLGLGFEAKLKLEHLDDLSYCNLGKIGFVHPPPPQYYNLVYGNLNFSNEIIVMQKCDIYKGGCVIGGHTFHNKLP